MMGRSSCCSVARLLEQMLARSRSRAVPALLRVCIRMVLRRVLCVLFTNARRDKLAVRQSKLAALDCLQCLIAAACRHEMQVMHVAPRVLRETGQEAARGR